MSFANGSRNKAMLHRVTVRFTWMNEPYDIAVEVVAYSPEEAEDKAVDTVRIMVPSASDLYAKQENIVGRVYSNP